MPTDLVCRHAPAFVLHICPRRARTPHPGYFSSQFNGEELWGDTRTRQTRYKGCPRMSLPLSMDLGNGLEGAMPTQNKQPDGETRYCRADVWFVCAGQANSSCGWPEVVGPWTSLQLTFNFSVPVTPIRCLARLLLVCQQAAAGDFLGVWHHLENACWSWP